MGDKKKTYNEMTKRLLSITEMNGDEKAWEFTICQNFDFIVYLMAEPMHKDIKIECN